MSNGVDEWKISWTCNCAPGNNAQQSEQSSCYSNSPMEDGSVPGATAFGDVPLDCHGEHHSERERFNIRRRFERGAELCSRASVSSGRAAHIGSIARAHLQVRPCWPVP